jgi:predicted alpha-1,2-mannosidase
VIKKPFHLVVLLFVVILFCSCEHQNSGGKDYTSLVNPFVGTIGTGKTFQGPVLPYGMIQPGPYMTYSENQQLGTIYGFSQTHLSGMAGGGVGTQGDILFMPTIEKGSFLKGFPTVFQHSNEIATPGYYKVKLDSTNIQVEITATTRTGLYSIAFPETDAAGVFLKIENGFLKVNGNEISGCNNNRVYFAARFSKPFNNFEIAANEQIINQPDTVKSENIKVFFRFDTKADEPVLMKIGISMVSVEGARNNLETEQPNWDFDLVRKNGEAAWNKELSKIQVEGGTENERILFYTALYHSLIHPNIYMDADHKYRSTNGKVYTADGFENYTNLSLWDTFRALHPLYTIINQRRTVDFIKTFLERYDHTGRMFVMEFDGVEGETPAMIGTHSLSVLADAYVKGIRDYDVPKAFEAMVKLADDFVRPDKELYLKYGFIPADLKGQSVSQTLEFSYDDWCVTRLAQDFNQDDYLRFSMRGDFYKNVFSPEVNFMRGRKSNFQFVENFDPMETINHYTEANAYQYSTFVPQDIEGLINLMGGDKVFENWLDSCFSVRTDFSKINLSDVTGLIGQYAHGNEPSHHIAYLYNYVGAPWKTHQMVRQIMSTLYQNKPEGIDGNEDCGQMSAWYVMSAMGFYAVTSGMDYYVIGSPVFDKVTINLENGKTFEIIAKNNSEKNKYIQSASLNDKPYSKTYLKHADIMNGGKLVFEMGNTPNKEWGINKEDRPYSPEKKFKYAKAPVPEFSDILFLESRTVKIPETEAGAKIYYTLDGSEPTEKSALFADSITIRKPTILRLRSFVEGIAPSQIVTVQFRKIDMLEAVNTTGLQPGVKYLYREGREVRTARDQQEAPVLKTGVLSTFNVDAIKDEREFGYNFDGYINVPETGVYTFWLEANDGAILYINGKLVIDNDGGHRAQVLDSKIGLKKGWHPIHVDYCQNGLAKSLVLEWEGPGVAKQQVPAEVLFH